MLGLFFALAVICLLVFMLYKKINAHMALLLSGLLLLSLSVIFSLDPIIDPKQSLHLGFFDVFQVVKTKFASTLKGLGLTIMCIAGFSAYMDHIGASYSLLAVFQKPLSKVKNPYILLVVSFIVIQFLVIFIPSHAGLALLLMVTMYPLLVSTGVSKLSALSIIGTCQFIDHGPGSGNVIMASKISEIDTATYFVQHQLPTTIPIIITVALANYFWQKYCDKKENFVFNAETVAKELADGKQGGDEIKKPSKLYAILPIVPLVLILGFSKIFDSPIKMNVPVAMLIATMLAIVFEIFSYGSITKALNSIMVFFKGMGHIFVITVSLIVCGQVFASGLVSVGFIDTLISFAKDMGVSVLVITIFISILLMISAFLMGSGNAAFFSFAPLIPNIAKSFGVDTISVIAPVQIMTGFGRCISPIAPAILAISTMTKSSPLQVIKRTSVPMIVAAITNIVCMYIYL